MRTAPAAFAATAAVLLLALTGCTSTPTTGDAQTSQQAGTEAEPVAKSPAPLVAETVEPDPSETLTGDALFLELIRAELPENTVIPNATDDQLIAAARAACEQIAAGVDVLAVNVIEGEEPNGLGYYESSAKIAAIGQPIYCP